MSIPSTVDRVPNNTSQAFNERIEQQTERNIAYYAAHPDEIDERIKQLDREWDIERTLEAHASSITIASVIMAALFSKKWLYVPAVVGGFLFQHSTQGWCPPLPILRRVGIRTQTEIERERYALKALRGDFNKIPKLEHAHEGNDEEGGGDDDGGGTRVSRRILEIVKG